MASEPGKKNKGEKSMKLRREMLKKKDRVISYAKCLWDKNRDGMPGSL